MREHFNLCTNSANYDEIKWVCTDSKTIDKCAFGDGKSIEAAEVSCIAAIMEAE